jgi:YbbR domain-containing protein
MINAEVLMDAIGPLPQSVTFQAPSDSSVMFVLTGTAYTQSAAATIGVMLILDGVQIGTASVCYANTNNVHMAMLPTFVELDNLTFGEHTLEVVVYGSQTVTDINDHFQVTLFY